MKVILLSSLAILTASAMTVNASDKKIVSFAWEWKTTGPLELLELQPQIAAVGLDGIGI